MTEPEVLDPTTVAADEAATRPTDKFNSSTAAEGATVGDPVDAPAPELTEVELLRLEKARLLDENAALKKDRAECIELAEEHAAKLRDHEDLKSLAKKAKDEADVLADALSKKVRGEVQTEIDPEDEGDQATIEFKRGAVSLDDVINAIEEEGEEDSDSDGRWVSAKVRDVTDNLKAAGFTSCDLAAILAAQPDGDVAVRIFQDDAIDPGEMIEYIGPKRMKAAPAPSDLDAIDVAGLDWSLVERSVLSALMSTGKPQKVKPVTILSLDYVCVDVQNRVAVFHQVMDAESFVNVHKVEGAIRPDERSEALALLGSVAGIPVKVSRKVMYLAANPFLVRVPPDAAISGTTTASDEPLAGPGSDMVANRIYVQLEHAPGVARMTVDALAKILGVDEDVVRNAAKSSDRLAYERLDDEETVARA